MWRPGQCYPYTKLFVAATSTAMYWFFWSPYDLKGYGFIPVLSCIQGNNFAQLLLDLLSHTYTNTDWHIDFLWIVLLCSAHNLNVLPCTEGRIIIGLSPHSDRWHHHKRHKFVQNWYIKVWQCSYSSNKLLTCLCPERKKESAWVGGH